MNILSLDRQTDRQTDRIVRDSSIELLRIIAMILIILYHLTIHSGLPMGTGTVYNDLFFQFTAFGGRVGVWCFVMITGYYSLYQPFRLRKLIRLMGQCWFYSILIAIFLTVFGIRVINHHEWILSLLPIGAFSWFASCYIVFYLFIPYLNTFILSLKRENLIKLLVISLVLWFLIPTLGTTVKLNLNTWGSAIMMFFFSYMVGAYCKINSTSRFIHVKPQKLVGLFFGLMIVYLFCSAVIYRLHFQYSFLANNPFYLSGDSIFTILFSVILFLFFINIDIGYYKYINVIAKTTFGIYLLHDNDLIRHYLWHTVFHGAKLYGDPFVIPKTVGIVICVFVIGMIIDFFRIQLLEKPVFKKLNPYLDQVQMKYSEKVDAIIARLL